MNRILAWAAPAPPPALREALEQVQYDSIDRQVPMLHAIAILNALVVILVSRDNNVPLIWYGWLFGMIAVSLVRIYRWISRSRRGPDAAQRARMLSGGRNATLAIIGVMSIWGTWSIVAGLYANPLTIPVTMIFSAMCATNSLVSIRSAACWGLVLAVVPMTTAMMVMGSNDAQVVGAVLLAVSAMKLRISLQQHDRIVASLELERRNAILANSDPLTGLANRRAIMAALEEAESAHHLSGQPFGLALLDLNGFKQVNDRFGHQAGDRLLVCVAERLRIHAGPEDMVGRLGGDEFVVLFRGVTQAEQVASRATALLARLCVPLDVDGRTIPVSAALGHAVAPHDGVNVDGLLQVADKALYAAKREGRSGAGNIRRGSRAIAA